MCERIALVVTEIRIRFLLQKEFDLIGVPRPRHDVKGRQY